MLCALSCISCHVKAKFNCTRSSWIHRFLPISSMDCLRMIWLYVLYRSCVFMQWLAENAACRTCTSYATIRSSWKRTMSGILYHRCVAIGWVLFTESEHIKMLSFVTERQTWRKESSTSQIFALGSVVTNETVLLNIRSAGRKHAFPRISFFWTCLNFLFICLFISVHFFMSENCLVTCQQLFCVCVEDM